MDQNRNLFIAVALSALFMLGWWKFFAEPQQLKLEAQHKAQIALQQKPQQKPADTPVTVAPPPGVVVQAPSTTLSRDAALKQGGARVVIDTPTLKGSLQLKGARFDDLKLKNYRETVDPKSPEINLLAPSGSEYPYFAQFGWSSADPKLALPNERTPWTLKSGNVLSPGRPVTLIWDNGQGLAFSADGHVLAFASLADNLVANDTNDRKDLFVAGLMPPSTFKT